MACASVLERLLERKSAAIRSVIPGVIRPVRDAKGEVRIRVTVPTTNGWKAIALSAGARQELFISTSLSKDQLEQPFGRHLARRSSASPGQRAVLEAIHPEFPPKFRRREATIALTATTALTLQRVSGR